MTTRPINFDRKEPPEGTKAPESLRKALEERLAAKRGYWPEKKRKVKRGE